MALQKFFTRLLQGASVYPFQKGGVPHRPGPGFPGIHVQIVETLGGERQFPVNGLKPCALVRRQIRAVIPEALHA